MKKIASQIDIYNTIHSQLQNYAFEQALNILMQFNSQSYCFSKCQFDLYTKNNPVYKSVNIT